MRVAVDVINWRGDVGVWHSSSGNCGLGIFQLGIADLGFGIGD
jgi:hypothetical protein